jgi:uncharacterized protein YukE
MELPIDFEKENLWQPQGYPKLAQLFERHPSTAIFRRFGFLNMMSLLRMQAKLMALEEKKVKNECKDADFTPGNINKLTRSFAKLEECATSQASQPSQASQTSQTSAIETLVQALDDAQNQLKVYSKESWKDREGFWC